LHHRIGAQELARKRIVDAALHVDEAEVAVVLVAREAAAREVGVVRVRRAERVEHLRERIASAARQGVRGAQVVAVNVQGFVAARGAMPAPRSVPRFAARALARPRPLRGVSHA
jgi:hypothetical protein